MPAGLFTKAYLTRKFEHAETLLRRIEARGPASRPGRRIPEAGDLPIGEGRTLEATVLFLDISGFSRRGSDRARDQEAMLIALTLFFGEMIRIVEDYGGRVEKNTGDGLMAYFAGEGLGAPPPQQVALEAALTIFAAAAWVINPRIRDLGLAPFEFRVCLDHGTITIAEIGAARRFRGIVAIGNSANIAAKMLTRARPGELLVGERVRPGLPQDWLQFLKDPTPTGWSWTATGRPYLAWRYAARWTWPAS